MELETVIITNFKNGSKLIFTTTVYYIDLFLSKEPFSSIILINVNKHFVFILQQRYWNSHSQYDNHIVPVLPSIGYFDLSYCLYFICYNLIHYSRQLTTSVLQNSMRCLFLSCKNFTGVDF